MALNLHEYGWLIIVLRLILIMDNLFISAAHSVFCLLTIPFTFSPLPSPPLSLQSTFQYLISLPLLRLFQATEKSPYLMSNVTLTIGMEIADDDNIQLSIRPFPDV